MELLIVFFLYFLPSFVALFRNHTSSMGIMILNLLLGWTFIFWVGALVWAASGKHPERTSTAVKYNRKQWKAGD